MFKPISILVLADDLTGAAETAAAFARSGEHVPLHLSGIPAASAIQVIDLDVRDAPLSVDVRAAYAAQAARVHGQQDLFIKIDSTLRGRIREALDGVISALPGRSVVCAPAFPATGRTMSKSVLYVHEMPLHRTTAWKLERGDVPRTFRDVLPRDPTACLGIDEIRSGQLAALLDNRGARPSLIVCDSEDDNDLARIAQVGRLAERPLIWVGSAGLAAALAADRLGGKAIFRRTDRETATAHYVAVLGSGSPVAHVQVKALVAAGAAWFPVVADHLECASDQWVESHAQSLQDMAMSGSVVVSLIALAANTGLTLPQRRARLVLKLAQIVEPAIEVAELVLLVGGATARAVLTACQVETLDVKRQLQPGIVSSLAQRRGRCPLQLLTKAGAFGSERTLVDLLYPVR